MTGGHRRADETTWGGLTVVVHRVDTCVGAPVAAERVVATGLHAAVGAHVECKPFSRNDFVAKKRAEISFRKAGVIRRRLRDMDALLSELGAEPAAMDES